MNLLAALIRIDVSQRLKAAELSDTGWDEMHRVRRNSAMQQLPWVQEVKCLGDLNKNPHLVGNG